MFYIYTYIKGDDILNNAEVLLNVLRKQNNFILGLFNDNRIDEDVKKEYMDKYNTLNIKTIEEIKEDC